MLFVFRCDASIQIGTGHVIRCLTLANGLKKSGYECKFICREHQGNLINYIRRQGYKVYQIPIGNKENTSNIFHAHWLESSQYEDAEECIKYIADQPCDWLIVDHYGIDSEWESLIKPYVNKLMSIDDLADRNHCCDILLDSNLGRVASDYELLVPNDCRLLINTKFSLLRDEFNQYREVSLGNRAKPKIEKILINLGGVDKDNNTTKLLNIIKKSNILPKQCQLLVILGEVAPHVAKVQEVAKQMPIDTEVLINITNMAEVMSQTDLVIGAPGTTNWERCALGLPTILLVIAENQRAVAHQMKAHEAAFYLDSTNFSEQLINILKEVQNNPNILEKISKKASELTDGLGVGYVIKALTEEQCYT